MFTSQALSWLLHLKKVLKNIYIILWGKQSSKSGHLNNGKKCKVFIIFSKLLLYLMIFLSTPAYLAGSTLKNHQILQCFLKKMMKNLPIILLLKWPHLEQKMFTVRYGSNRKFMTFWFFRGTPNIHIQTLFPCILSHS